MHIAYLTSEYPHQNLPPAGGIGAFIKTMAYSLVKNGHEVVVFVCQGTENKEWIDNQVRIIQVSQNHVGKIGVFKNKFHINKILRENIAKLKIDIVEAPDWEGLHSLCNIKIPIITRIHGSVTYFNTIEGSKVPRIINYFEKKALKKSNSIISVSNYSGAKTKEIFNLKEISIQTIYNGVDTNKFKPIEKELVKNSNKTILYFGTLIRKKGVLEIPLIFNKLISLNPNVELVLLGKDALDPLELKSTWSMMQKLFTKEAIGKVNYLGVIQYDKMMDYINDSKVCIFPSYAEAFPISWLEAMAMGKPVVASSIGWAEESIVDGVSGFLVHPKNHSEYAKKINQLIFDTKISEELGINARKRVLRFFNQEILLSENLVFYKRVIDEK